MRLGLAASIAALAALPLAAQVAEGVPELEERPQPTPMEERTATLAVLDKVSQQTFEYEMSPGDSVEYRGIALRLVACEATPPWAEREEAGAFVQIDSRRGEDTRRLFSGWLFANSPSLNSFDNPAYDVWVRSCTMAFPETDPETTVVN